MDAQPVDRGRRLGRRAARRARGQRREPGQGARVDGADPGRGDGALPCAQERARQRTASSSLVGQNAPKNKGKSSRVLAAKAALCIRVNELGETSEATIGCEARAKVEACLRLLEIGKPSSLEAAACSGRVSWFR